MHDASTVPLLPPLDESFVDSHREAHRELHDALVHADPSVERLFRIVQLRILEESLAGVSASTDEGISGRRRSWSPRAEARVLGSRRLVAHVDARLEMWRTHHQADLVGFDTPEVLNALAESSDPEQRETDAGLVRATSSALPDDTTGYRPPEPAACEGLLRQAIDLVNRAPAPAIARAGWLATTLIALHPFVDGNGRTARAAFQLVASSELDAGFDWGVLEVWANDRSGYVDALMRCRSGADSDYRGDLIDASPFMEHGCETSRRGAIRALDRLRRIDSAWAGEWVSASWDARRIEVATWAQGTATLRELATLVDEPRCTTIVNQLVAADRLAWGAFGHLAIGPDHPLRALR